MFDMFPFEMNYLLDKIDFEEHMYLIKSYQ